MEICSLHQNLCKVRFYMLNYHILFLGYCAMCILHSVSLGCGFYVDWTEGWLLRSCGCTSGIFVGGKEDRLLLVTNFTQKKGKCIG